MGEPTCCHLCTQQHWAIWDLHAFGSHLTRAAELQRNCTLQTSTEPMSMCGCNAVAFGKLSSLSFQLGSRTRFDVCSKSASGHAELHRSDGDRMKFHHCCCLGPLCGLVSIVKRFWNPVSLMFSMILFSTLSDDGLWGLTCIGCKFGFTSVMSSHVFAVGSSNLRRLMHIWVNHSSGRWCSPILIWSLVRLVIHRFV